VTTPPRRIVVADANVLINLMHVARLDMCARLRGYELVVPDHVREEVTEPAQRAALDDAVARGVFRIEAITDLNAVALFAELTVHVGRGEAACLAIAVKKGWTLASDEKRRFRREAETRLGKERIIRTADLFVLAIQAGLLTVKEADADKAMLERHRFKMPFGSFRDLVK
jgi:predicted nucleic acid-binding protein